MCKTVQAARLQFDRIDDERVRFVGASVVPLSSAVLEAHFISRKLYDWSPNPGDDVERVEQSFSGSVSNDDAAARRPGTFPTGVFTIRFSVILSRFDSADHAGDDPISSPADVRELRFGERRGSSPAHFGRDVLVPDLAGWRRSRLPEVPDDAYLTLRAPREDEPTFSAIELWGCNTCHRLDAARLEFRRRTPHVIEFVGARVVPLSKAVLDEANYISRRIDEWAPMPGDDVERLVELERRLA